MTDIIEQLRANKILLKGGNMERKIITDNESELLKVIDDTERFAIVHYIKTPDSKKTIILNPREAKELAMFILARLEIK